MKRSRLVLLSAALASALALAAASSASAAPITLGPPLATTSFGSTTCSNPGCTFTNLALPAGSQLASPVDGAIVSWSLKGASATPGYALRVLNVSGTTMTGFVITGIATSTHETPAGAGLQTFATALPIKQGQHIGIDVPKTGQFGTSGISGAIVGEVQPLLAEGVPAIPTQFPDSEVGFSAQVQPAPTISALGITSGPAAGGTSVLIAGTDFTGATAVKFGGTSAAFSVTSENTITATSPASATAGAVPVTVTTVAGTASSAQQFLYVASTPPPAPVTPVVIPKPTCKVPKLKGKTLKSAKKRIRAADCRVGTLTKKEGATAKDGEVVKQVPKPGVTVPAETKVKVTLAP